MFRLCDRFPRFGGGSEFLNAQFNLFYKYIILLRNLKVLRGVCIYEVVAQNEIVYTYLKVSNVLCIKQIHSIQRAIVPYLNPYIHVYLIIIRRILVVPRYKNFYYENQEPFRGSW